MVRFVLFLLAVIFAAPAMAHGICFCPLCAIGVEKNYRQHAEAMAPALRGGDCFRAKPGNSGIAPGDMVVFQHPQLGEMVFRLIATQGQRVAVSEGTPVIDGVQVDSVQLDPVQMPRRSLGVPDECIAGTDDCIAVPSIETLPNGASYEVLDSALASPGDYMEERIVPPGHVFLMGDNRDNAFDSRFLTETGGPGMVALEDVIGVVIAPDP